jgi:hypothetical protein
MERLARDKLSSFSQTFITYGCKKFYNIGLRLYIAFADDYRYE